MSFFQTAFGGGGRDMSFLAICNSSAAAAATKCSLPRSLLRNSSTWTALCHVFCTLTLMAYLQASTGNMTVCWLLLGSCNEREVRHL
jgi:hypothetical protein